MSGNPQAGNPQGVRRATAEDVPELAGFALALFAEEALQALSEEKVRRLVRRCVTNGIAGIIVGADGIEASIGLEISQFEYSAADHLTIRWLGTAPAYRRHNHGARLLNFAAWGQKALSEAAGQPMPLLAEIATLKDLSNKLHLYARTAHQVGAIFSFGLSVPGAFNQRKAGDDPFGEQVRKSRAARL